MRTLILLICSVLCASASLFSQTGVARITPAGNRVINHTNRSGAKIKPGDKVKFHVIVFIRDSMVQNTMRDKQLQEQILPDPMPAQIHPIFEAMLMLAEGDSVSIFQKMDSLQAVNLSRQFGGEVKEFRFDLKIVHVADQTAVKARHPEIKALVDATLADYKAGKLGDRLQKTASGLELVVLEPGRGNNLQMGDTHPTHYMGVLKSDGYEFDSSFKRGSSAPFSVGRMIPGFNEGMMLLKPGGKAILFIPWPLGYGESGNPAAKIPQRADLVFYIELE